MVSALRNINNVVLPGLPRMADFARWVTAAEEGLGWSQGTFIKAYEANRMNLIDIALEADMVATAIINLMELTAKWAGTPSELYETLKRLVPDYERKTNAWPRAANALSGRLIRSQTFLRKKGIEIERAKSGNRIITIRQMKEKSAQIVHPEEPSCGKRTDPQRVYNAGDFTFTLPRENKLPTNLFGDEDASDDKDDTQGEVNNDDSRKTKAAGRREEGEI
jgi:hypothetical protein